MDNTDPVLRLAALESLLDGLHDIVVVVAGREDGIEGKGKTPRAETF